MLPALVHDNLTTPFNYYRDEHIHQGLICQNRMYSLAKLFDREQRGQAIALALKLSHNDIQPLITVSACASYYRVWLDIRDQDSEVLKGLLAEQPQAVYQR